MNGARRTSITICDSDGFWRLSRGLLLALEIVMA